MPMTDRRRRITAFMVAMAVLIATPLVVVATDAFTDVPDSNVHHGDITWLRDADVTRGCNPPANDRFCPGDPVLRQQMASFMRRLAENQVVDAGWLGGEEPDAYRTIVAADLDSDVNGVSSTDPVDINTVNLTAPAPGVIVVGGAAVLVNDSGNQAVVGIQPTVNGTAVPGSGGNAAFGLLEANEDTILSYTVAFEVGAGTHAVTQAVGHVHPITGALIPGDFFYNGNNLTATWHPEGSVSLATAASGSGGLLGD